MYLYVWFSQLVDCLGRITRHGLLEGDVSPGVVGLEVCTIPSSLSLLPACGLDLIHYTSTMPACLSAAILLTMMDLDSPSKTVNNKLFFKLLSLVRILLL